MNMFATKFQLRVLSGPGAGTVSPLTRPHFNLGRAHQKVDDTTEWIFLEDSTVSRLHAEIVWAEEHQSYQLFHRSQTNPTMVNQQAVDKVLLGLGDEIRLGMVAMKLEHFKPVAAEERTTTKFSRPAFCIEDRDGELTLEVDGDEVDWRPNGDTGTLKFRWDPGNLSYQLVRPEDYQHDVYVTRQIGGKMWSTLLRGGESVNLLEKDRLRSAGERVVFTKKQTTSVVL